MYFNDVCRLSAYKLFRVAGRVSPQKACLQNASASYVRVSCCQLEGLIQVTSVP